MLEFCFTIYALRKSKRVKLFIFYCFSLEKYGHSWFQIKYLTASNKALYLIFTEAVVQRCSVKKVFLKISQNSQENTCARVSF